MSLRDPYRENLAGPYYEEDSPPKSPLVRELLAESEAYSNLKCDGANLIASTLFAVASCIEKVESEYIDLNSRATKLEDSLYPLENDVEDLDSRLTKLEALHDKDVTPSPAVSSDGFWVSMDAFEAANQEKLELTANRDRLLDVIEDHCDDYSELHLKYQGLKDCARALVGAITFHDPACRVELRDLEQLL